MVIVFFFIVIHTDCSVFVVHFSLPQSLYLLVICLWAICCLKYKVEDDDDDESVYLPVVYL